jgi:hypothetical protein
MNDIIILETNNPFVLSEIVKLACLPGLAVPIATTCTVSGWGKGKKSLLLPIFINQNIRL